MARPCTGRRVSSLVPWGGSEEPETVEVSQDVVNRRGEGYWKGEGAGGKEKEMEQAREEEEREQAREKAKEKEREQEREQAREEERGLKEKEKVGR